MSLSDPIDCIKVAIASRYEPRGFYFVQKIICEVAKLISYSMLYKIWCSSFLEMLIYALFYSL